jgi:hypothetical protein
LTPNLDMAAHINNFKKIIDDLRLNLSNIRFNKDSNQALTQQRAIDRFGYIRGGSVKYNCHLTFT